MTAYYTIERIRSWGHTVGLHRIEFLRKGIDYVKWVGITTVPPVSLRVQGFWIQGLPLSHYVRGAYEPSTTEFFKKTIQPGWTAIDVGANYGYFTLLFSKLVGSQGRVFSFEPFVTFYAEFLLPNIARNKSGNVIPVPLGLDEKATKRHYFTETNGFYSKETSAIPAQEAPVVSLDAFFEAYGGRVDIIKIDTEGSELRVLRGMREIIKKNPDLYMVIEVAPRVLQKAGFSQKELLNFLEELGMFFFWIEEGGEVVSVSRAELEKRLSRVKYTNILCRQNV